MENGAREHISTLKNKKKKKEKSKRRKKNKKRKLKDKNKIRKERKQKFGSMGAFVVSFWTRTPYMRKARDTGDISPPIF